jgi:hypothetical protein
MKKKSLSLFFSIWFFLMPIMISSAGNRRNPDHDTIERIEQKYKALRKHALYVKANGVPVARSIRFIQKSDRIGGDFNKLRQIALIRHGEPDIQKDGKFTCDEANQFLKCYDSVCIIVPEKPFFYLDNKEEVAVFSSPINRALTTAQYLCGMDRSISVSSEFREFENKIWKSKSDKRRSIKIWTTTSRLKWMLDNGEIKGIESFSDAKKRALKAANILADASKTNPKVLLTAHGMLNTYIKKNLKKMGWSVVEDTGNDYFGTTILVKVD